MQHVGHRESDEVHQLRKQLAIASENFRGTWAALGQANKECTRLSAENARLRAALVSFPTMTFSIAEARAQKYPELVAYGEALLDWLSKHKATRDAALAHSTA